MALVYDLHYEDRDMIIAEAAVRTQHLWPSKPEGALAHSVWVEFIKDLARQHLHDGAMDDLNGTDCHWWIEGMGVGRPYLMKLLRDWGFIGDGVDFGVELDPMAGQLWCSGGKHYAPGDAFARELSAVRGVRQTCRDCENDARIAKRAANGAHPRPKKRVERAMPKRRRKIDDDDVREIRRLAAQEDRPTFSEIGQQFGIGQSMVSAIVNRRKHGHVD